jgi:undecaprenyl-diphosphatase
MNWLDATILGLLQGLTEFLPVSSSGHLVLGKYLLGIVSDGGSGLVFEIMVHFGTALSIMVVYREKVLELVTGFVRGLRSPGSWDSLFARESSFRTSILILLSMVPAGIAYAAFGSRLESLFDDPRFAASMLLVTGVLLGLTLLKRHTSGKLTAPRVIVMGLAQALAMIPGISRSGATISSALYMDVEPEEAANFSFLMLLPVVLGAAFLKVLVALQLNVVVSWGPILLGTVVAFISGIVAIRTVIRFVRKGRLHWFAAYCFLVGGLALLLL